MAVAVAVGAPVIVAALVNRNDIVKVVDAARRSRSDELREHGHDALELLKVQHASDIGRHRRRLRARLRALITATASFPLTSAATTPGATTATASNTTGFDRPFLDPMPISCRQAAGDAKSRRNSTLNLASAARWRFNRSALALGLGMVDEPLEHRSPHCSLMSPVVQVVAFSPKLFALPLMSTPPGMQCPPSTAWPP